MILYGVVAPNGNLLAYTLRRDKITAINAFMRDRHGEWIDHLHDNFYLAKYVIKEMK